MSISTGSLRATVFPRSTALTHATFIVGGTLFIAALAQIAVPVPGSPVPVTGQTLAVYLIGTTYGARLGFATFATYLLAGIAGAPVFAAATGATSHGIARLTGATGGYLIGNLVKNIARPLLVSNYQRRPNTFYLRRTFEDRNHCNFSATDLAQDFTKVKSIT
ncbi:MAG: biotin transporter BioY [Actinobacteria bacterium]|nr:biotin transporter BioY [Actinomycetota bacterium]